MKEDTSAKLVGILPPLFIESCLAEIQVLLDADLKYGWTVSSNYKLGASGLRKTLPLRGSALFRTNPVAAMGKFEWVEQNRLLAPKLCSIAEHISDFADVNDFGMVNVAEMKPQARVANYFDAGEYYTHYHRYHVTLQTNPQFLNLIDGEAITMNVGEVWQLDNFKVQNISNNSMDETRYSMFLDGRKV